MTLAELEEKLSLMSRSSTCNVEPHEAREMLAAVRKAVEATVRKAMEATVRRAVEDEREACARECDRIAKAIPHEATRTERDVAAALSLAIRARGGR